MTSGVTDGQGEKTVTNRWSRPSITGVENETSQTMLIQFEAAPERIELQKRA